MVGSAHLSVLADILPLPYICLMARATPRWSVIVPFSRDTEVQCPARDDCYEGTVVVNSKPNVVRSGALWFDPTSYVVNGYGRVSSGQGTGRQGGGTQSVWVWSLTVRDMFLDIWMWAIDVANPLWAMRFECR